VLRRFAEYHDLEGAFGRHAITERAKGILMERRSVNDATAFDMRDHSRDANRTLFDTSPLPSSTATASCPKTLTPEPGPTSDRGAACRVPGGPGPRRFGGVA
jgi:ANTAR domain-containing protein